MLSQMAQRLNAISMGMGFKEAAKPEILLNLSTWIKNQFGDMSMQEIALAFDLVTAKKIGQDIRHYNTFSQQYVGEVLYAFKAFRAKHIKLHRDAEASKQLENMDKGATGQEMYEGIKRIALESGKIMKVANWTDAYNYAWKENLIHRMSDQERTEYKDAVVKAMETEKRANLDIGMTGSIQSECHKRILHAHFQQIIDNE